MINHIAGGIINIPLRNNLDSISRTIQYLYPLRIPFHKIYSKLKKEETS